MTGTVIWATKVSQGWMLQVREKWWITAPHLNFHPVSMKVYIHSSTMTRHVQP